jgi:hypothetical protein
MAAAGRRLPYQRITSDDLVLGVGARIKTPRGARVARAELSGNSSCTGGKQLIAEYVFARRSLRDCWSSANSGERREDRENVVLLAVPELAVHEDQLLDQSLRDFHGEARQRPRSGSTG